MFKSTDEYSSYKQNTVPPVTLKHGGNVYYSFKTFLRVCRRCNIKNIQNYRLVAICDKRLPPDPQMYYNPSFVIRDIWNILMGRRYTFKQFLKVVQGLNFKDVHDYSVRYKEDPRLPRDPYALYKTTWGDYGGWSCVTGRPKKVFFKFEEFVQECIKLELFSAFEYELYRENEPRFPNRPDNYYKNKIFQKMGGWKGIRKLYEEKQLKKKTSVREKIPEKV